MASKPKSAAPRKRATSIAPSSTPDGCVITYYFNDRAFQRLFVEANIEQMKDVVRQKLNLPPTTALNLAQLVDNYKVDLEDEDDFSALKFCAAVKSEIRVEVTATRSPVRQLASPTVTSPTLEHPPVSAASSSRQSAAQATVPAIESQKTNASTAPAAVGEIDQTDKLELPAPKKPAPKKAASKRTPASGTPLAPAGTTQTKPKKRARKGEAEGDTTATKALDTATETDQHVEPAPPKKKRKPKASEQAAPSASDTGSLPPPDPPRPKSSAIAKAKQPASTVPTFTGPNTDFLQRWASGYGGGVSKLATPATVPAEEEKPKRKKKAKETSAPVPIEDTPPEPCSVCQASHPGSEFPLDCPLLARHDDSTVSFVRERVKELVAEQGSGWTNQMTIIRLKDWLKQQEEAEAQESVASSDPSMPVSTETPAKPTKNMRTSDAQPSASAANQTRLLSLKKPKISAMVVSHQSEHSSSDDEAIINSVMQPLPQSDDESESAEEDDAPETEAKTPEPERKAMSPLRSNNLSTIPSKGPVPAPSKVMTSLSKPGTKEVVRSRQRLTQTHLRALLDNLEEEEASGRKSKENSDEDEDDGGSELAESTPSDVARKRHKQNARIDTDDSDAASEDEVGDARMTGPGTGQAEEENLSQTGREDSQMDKSSQNVLQRLAVRDGDEAESKHQEPEEIEEYTSDEDVDEDPNDSPIEPADKQGKPLGEAKPGSEGEEESEGEEGEEEHRRQVSEAKPSTEPEAVTKSPAVADTATAAEAPPLPSKKKGRPPLSQAVKDERAAEKARIKAEKAAERAAEKAEKALANPKKRARPSLAQSVDGEEAADKQKAKKARTGTPSTANGKTNAMTFEISLPAPKNHSSPSKSVEMTDETSASRKRGRPRLSPDIVAERAAEKERLQKEKAIKKMEEKTAKANAKRGKKKQQNDEDPNKTVDSTTSIDPENEEESHPQWEVMKPPSSSSAVNSQQADEIDWTPMPNQRNTKISQGLTPMARPMLPNKTRTEDPDTENQPSSKGIDRPLFVPSSGLTQTSARPGLLSSSPLVPVRSSDTSQRAPAVRRKSTASSLPRFTELKREHELSRTQRRATLAGQQTDSQSQSSKPKDNDAEVISEDSSSDEGSSGAEGEEPTAPSQKKRRSVFGYFT